MALPQTQQHSLRWLLWAGTGLTLVYLVACCSTILHPQTFPYITFLTIGFPFLFVGYLVWCVLAFYVWGKKSAWWAFLLLAAGPNLSYLWGTGWGKPEPVKSKTLTVLSWNVNEFFQGYENDHVWQPKRERMLAYIQEKQPDVLCFQDYAESAGFRAENLSHLIARTLQYPYHYFSKDATDYGTAIFSRFPIVEQGHYPYKTKERSESLAFADLLIKGDTVRVFNTHFSSMFLHHNRLGIHNVGTIEVVKEDTSFLFHSNRWQRMQHYDVVHSAQAKQAKIFMNASPHPFVFCGDLNAVPNSHVYSQLKKGLKDAFLEERFGMEGTYHSFNPILRIDVILYSPAFQSLHQESPRLDLSDHYPLLARFTW
ncbi:MAG: hypothetical protein EAZ62_05520 [Sphingobacteriia bacterium]|nr:MAG: hypothetical protein EAZ62_05520 [Sphingobacteriia bacterium]